MKAVSVNGVLKQYRDFPPNVGQVIDWCEKEQAWLVRMADREKKHSSFEVFHKEPPPYDPIKRAAEIMGRALTPDGRLGRDAETVRIEEEDKVKRRVLIDRANQAAARSMPHAVKTESKEWQVPISQGLVDTIKSHPSYRDYMSQDRTIQDNHR